MASPAETATDPSAATSNREAIKTPSWSSVVQNRPSLSKYDFSIQEIDGSPCVEVPDHIIDNSTPLWEDFLIGMFLAPAPHVAKIHVIVNKIWPLGDKSIKIDVFVVNKTTVKFRIKEDSVRARILRRGMWNVAEIPMVVSKWSPVVEESQSVIKSLPIWVLLKNVPRKMFSWDGIGFLASPVGDPKRLHPDTVECKSFEVAKVFVEADLTRELPKSFRFKSDKGVDAIVEYEYPWLPSR